MCAIMVKINVVRVYIMKISINNSDCNKFEFYKKCGFDACDFSLEWRFFNRTNGKFADIDSVTEDQLREEFTYIAQKAKEAGIEIGQTHAECSGQIRDYGHDIEDMLKRAIASIKATHYLGCKYCVVHPLFVSGRVYDKKCKENFDAAVEFYKKLIPYLEEYDVYCCVENMWNCDPVYMNICSTILSHAQEMVDMCNVLGDRFKICLDVGHALLTQDDPAEMVRICGDKLVCLHTHDNDGFSDLHAFPFNKSAAPYATRWKPMRCDWNAFMKALDEVNYRGNLNFEVGVPGPPELSEATHKYLVAIAQYLISLRTVQY